MTERNRIYRIRIRGQLAPSWSDWFDGLQVLHTDKGDTVLAGPVADQAALFGILARVQALNLTLLALTSHDSDDSHVPGDGSP